MNSDLISPDGKSPDLISPDGKLFLPYSKLKKKDEEIRKVLEIEDDMDRFDEYLIWRDKWRDVLKLEALIIRRIKRKEYTQVNDDIIKEQKRQWRAKNKEAERERVKKYYKENKEKVDMQRKIWREKNKEILRIKRAEKRLKMKNNESNDLSDQK